MFLTKSAKVLTTFSDYAVGRKNFSTATLVATILATAFGGGGFIRTVQYVHKQGLYWIMFSVLIAVTLWITSLIAGRMKPFMHHLSIAETIGSIYGCMPRVVTAVCNVMGSIAILAMQIHVMAHAISVYTDLFHPRIMTTLATLIFITYTAWGGVRAVTYTDIFQLITFIIIIPILAWLLFQQTGKSIIEVVSLLGTQEKFQYSHVFSWSANLLSVISLGLSGLAFVISPPILQRVYMASSTMQAKKGFLYASICSLVIISFMLLVGIAVFVNAPNLPIQDVWEYIIDHIPPCFKSFFYIGFLALAMSTADSHLNACAVMVSHDIIEPMWRKGAIVSAQKLAFAQSASIIVGMCAMVLTFYCTDLLELLKLALDFSVPIATAPFIFAVLGFKGDAKTALTGMVVGALSIIVWKIWVEPTIDINGAFFVC
ncbi:sodium:solute symporter family protein [Cardinium endosymbiont of Culicoides punctatus]|uniref:sodium:solute symporter family protein n=1 Tax=Cardinium endosymbiont of Culicoides punctatus TaxID=2304601 RepID=UPI001058EC89|nr:hypothetical protein [Cardinium endosymbiont of Culicoides punctatus]TDG95677.1 hypothetical protein CCPUN_01390 [Cardinium endosymbiont of Culicoides punctatus]